MKRIIFTGGGTGGHVYPGIAVYNALPEELRRSAVWIGSRNGIEGPIVEAAGIPFYRVSSGKLRRYFDLENVVDLFRVLAGIAQAISLLKRITAEEGKAGSVIFSKGGFVAVPVVIAARIIGVPIVIHESDSDPGLATRITARFAKRICVPYGDTIAAFPRQLQDRCVVTGNPVRRAFFDADPAVALRSVGLPETPDPVVLVTGGSLGAQQLNRWVDAVIPELTRDAVVVHQTGAHGEGAIKGISRRARPGRYAGAPTYTEAFPALLRRADVVVARAGAGTIWEIAVAGRPAILVPLSRGASRGDQIRNAERYCRSGAAETIADPEADAGEFLAAVNGLLEQPQRRREMTEAAHRWAAGDAAQQIAEIVLSFLDPSGTDR